MEPPIGWRRKTKRKMRRADRRTSNENRLNATPSRGGTGSGNNGRKSLNNSSKPITQKELASMPEWERVLLGFENEEHL